MSEPLNYEQLAQVVEVMFDTEDLMLRTENGDIYASVNCSDVFFWGSADAEPVTPETLPVLLQASSDLPDWMDKQHTAELYAARIRGQRPQGAMYKYLPIYLWPLFDACGPERETGLGNPVAH